MRWVRVAPLGVPAGHGAATTRMPSENLLARGPLRTTLPTPCMRIMPSGRGQEPGSPMRPDLLPFIGVIQNNCCCLLHHGTQRASTGKPDSVAQCTSCNHAIGTLIPDEIHANAMHSDHISVCAHRHVRKPAEPARAREEEDVLPVHATSLLACVQGKLQHNFSCVGHCRWLQYGCAHKWQRTATCVHIGRYNSMVTNAPADTASQIQVHKTHRHR